MPSIAIAVSLRGQLLSGVKFQPSSLFSSNEPGVWYDPSDVANLDWRRNLLTYTEQFDNGAWVKNGVTVSPNAAAAPDGTVTADKFVGTTASDGKFVYQSATFGGLNSFSFYAKAAEYYLVRVIEVGTYSFYATFNLQTGAVTAAGGANFVSASAVYVDNGWYRCVIVNNKTTANPYSIAGFPDTIAPVNTPATYTGDGASGVYIWGAQAELGSAATEYQRITDVNTEVRERFPNATLYQDTAGAIPVTTPGQSVALMLDKSGRGNHATQATAASRPTYGIVPKTGRRNLLERSEEFNDAYWLKNGGSSVSTNTIVAPNGTLTADRVSGASGTDFTGAVLRTNSAVFPKSSSNTISAYVIADGATTLRMYYRDGTTGSIYSTAAVSLSASWQRITLSVPTANGGIVFWGAANGNFGLWGAQFEAGTATAYQRVGSQYDVTEAGVPSLSYLRFDGVDDWMVTPTITPGIDKVQVFAGVRKLSDAAIGMVAETSPTGDPGSMGLRAPNAISTEKFGFASRATAFAKAASTTLTAFSAPVTCVLAGYSSISEDNVVLRANGSQVGQDTSDQGTGNYLAYPLYIGRRGGTTLPFNGDLFGLIVRFGANLDAGAITNTETWINNKTGAY